MPTTSTANSVSATDPVRVWFPVVLAFFVVCLPVGFVFWHEVSSAITVWTESTTYNHCFLIIPMTIALLWHRRELIKKTTPQPAPVFLLIVPILSFAWLLFSLIEINEFEQFVVIGIVEVIILTLIGSRAFRTLLAPLLFLFFLVPFGQFLVPPLQQFTTAFAIQGLQLFNIPVLVDGFVIRIPEGSFEIAEACAGLRFLIASIVFGCFFATVMYRSVSRRLVFIGLSIVVPIVANGLRALGLILLGHLEGNAAAVEADHILYGWIFFSLVILILIAVGMTFAERSGPMAAEGMPVHSVRMSRLIFTSALGLLLVSLGPAYLAIIINRASAEPIRSSLLVPPSEWSQEPNATASWLPGAAGSAQISLLTYRWNETEVTKFMALYPLPARGSAFTSSQNGVADPKPWQVGQTAQKTVSRSGAAPLPVNATIIEHGSKSRLVWWFYVVDNQATTSIFEAKILQARTAFLGGGHIGALVAISTEAQDLQTANGTLSHFMDAMTSWRELRPAHFGLGK